MAWYRTGTIAVTNGSTTVTGIGTAFVGAVLSGYGFVGPDGRNYEIGSVISATSLTLSAPYMGSTQSGATYSIFPTYAALIDLTTQLSALVSDYQSVKDTAGQGKFGDGTAAVPGLRFVADEDTGIRRKGLNALAMVAGGADRLEVNAAGAVLTGLLTGTAVMQSVTDLTAGRLLTTGAGPAQAFKRGNILGTVSQAGGIPTGALIEHGSNANGSYVRYAGGMQICSQTLTAGSIVSQGAGTFAAPYRSVDQNWTFPASFAATPLVQAMANPPSDAAASAPRRTAFAVRANANTVAAYQIGVVRVGTDTTADVFTIEMTAYGRWF